MTVLDMLADLDRELAGRDVVLHLAGLPDSAAGVAGKDSWYAGLRDAGRAHHTVGEGLTAAAA